MVIRLAAFNTFFFFNYKLNIIIYYKVIDRSLVGFVLWFNDLYSFSYYFIKKTQHT